MFLLSTRFVFRTFLQATMWFQIYYMSFSLVQCVVCVAKFNCFILILQNVIVIVSSSSKPIYLYNEFLSYDSVLPATTIPLLQRFGERCGVWWWGWGGLQKESESSLSSNHTKILILVRLNTYFQRFLLQFAMILGRRKVEYLGFLKLFCYNSFAKSYQNSCK